MTPKFAVTDTQHFKKHLKKQLVKQNLLIV